MPVSKLSLDFQGMVTAPGRLQAPAGALQKATNINFLAPGYAEKRRGIQRMTTYMGEVGWKVINSPLLNANILANVGNSLGASTLRVGNGGGAWTTVLPPDALAPPYDSFCSNTPSDRMRATVLLQNHYLTFNRATGRYGNLGTFAWGGMPLPLGFHYESLTGAGGAPAVLNVGTAGTAPYWLADGYACAYRVVWVLLDDAGAEIQSAPSGRLVVQNASGTTGWSGSKSATVNLRILVPYQSDTGSTPITTSWIYRVYRSKQRQISTGQPDDEMQLVYEGSPTSGQISTGYIDLTDLTPEAAMDGALYTNETVGRESGLDLAPGGDAVGLAGSNWRPPLAKECAAWSDCVFWGNFKTPQRITFSILAVGSTGVQNGSVFAFKKQGALSFTLTGSTTGAAPGSTTFLVQTGWTSIAANIRDTAINLCAAINALKTNTFLTATYIGSDASPGTIGQILLEARRSDLAAVPGGAPAFEVEYAPVGTENPFLPPMALESSCDTWTNGVAFSRRFQGDSVPLVNYTRIGRNDAEVLAMVPLRDALFVFTNHGLYWVRGTTPSDFRIEEFDLTFRLLGRELVVACEDALYAWGQEGIAKITNGGVQFIDLPIRNLVQQAIVGLDGLLPANFQGVCGFAVSYRVERRVLFFFRGGTELASDKETEDEYGCRYALVWNLSTGSWSQYDLTQTCGKCTGVVRYSDETLVASEWDGIPGGAAYLYQESKTNAVTDYQDSDRGAVTRPITTTLEWTTFSPDPSSLCHWRETQIYYNVNEYIPAFGIPTTSTLKVETEFTDVNGAPQTTTWTPNSQQNRILMEPAVGMATRMVLTLTHAKKAEYFNLGGWALLYSVASTFNTR